MPLILATDKIINLANGSVAFTKLPQTPSDVFCVTLGHDSSSPSGANTYRFGTIYQLGPVTTVGDQSRAVISPFNGTLVAASIAFNRTGAGSAGNCSMVVANTTAGTSVTITNSLDYVSNTNFNAVYTSLSSFSVNSGDTLVGQWVVPTLATYPTSVRHSVLLWFKRILA